MKLTPLFFYFLIIFSAYSQNDTLPSPFISYGDKLSVGLTYFDSSNVFYLNNENEQYKEISFVPNTHQQLITSIDYESVSVAYGFTPNFMKTQYKELPSKQFFISGRMHHKQWSQSLTFIYQKGFFVNYNDLHNIYVPELRTYKLGTKISYTFNKNFSFRAVFNENQWQKKSYGSFITNLSFHYTNLNFHRDSFYKKRDLYTLSLIPSYYYNFVIKECILLSAGIETGGGIYIEQKEVYPLQESSANFKIGYNHPSFFSYVGLNITNLIQHNNTSNNVDLYTTFRFSIGYRFSTPKKIKELYQKTLGRLEP